MKQMVKDVVKKMTKNCINCGAPFELEHHKCPYCGTTYFDNLMCIDLKEISPVVFKVRMPSGQFVTMMFQPRAAEMTVNYGCETAYVSDSRGTIIHSMHGQPRIELTMEAVPIPEHHGAMYIVAK